MANQLLGGRPFGAAAMAAVAAMAGGVFLTVAPVAAQFVPGDPGCTQEPCSGSMCQKCAEDCDNVRLVCNTESTACCVLDTIVRCYPQSCDPFPCPLQSYTCYEASCEPCD